MRIYGPSEVERLQGLLDVAKELEVKRVALIDRQIEQLRTLDVQLAAMTVARDEACEHLQLLVDSLTKHSPVADTPPFQQLKRELERRITALLNVGSTEPRKVGAK